MIVYMLQFKGKTSWWPDLFILTARVDYSLFRLDDNIWLHK